MQVDVSSGSSKWNNLARLSVATLTTYLGNYNWEV